MQPKIDAEIARMDINMFIFKGAVDHGVERMRSTSRKEDSRPACPHKK
jgi:hypothetical protein